MSVPFQTSGVIEGFYGPPWSHQDRLDMLRFMGEVGLQAYFYAPKDDPFHRTRWREDYPPARYEELRVLVLAAQDHHVEFWYAISPGLSIVYSDSTDYEALLRKIDHVSALGVRHVGLFVDDVPASLSHRADRDAYGTLAAAHVALTNRLHGDLATRGISLALTPTTYTNAWGDRAYIAEIGAGVVEDVQIFWTGPDVASPTISPAQAEAWGRLLRRRPLLWDNYPVNDYARWRLFLGPFTGRHPDLASTTAGIIANPMNEAHASMIALATLAAYARDPSGYDPATALDAALARLYGDAAADVQPLIRIFGDYGWDDNVFGPLYFLPDTIDARPIGQALEDLAAGLARMRAKAATNPALGRLADDVEPHVATLRARLAELRRSSMYEQSEDMLVYRTDLDRYPAASVPAPPTIDGDVSDVDEREWVPLFLDPDTRSESRVAFRQDAEFLYVAFRVANADIRPRPGEEIGEGDHMAVVVDGDPEDGAIGPEELVLLLPPPGDEPPTIRATAFGFQGFMAKWLADNRALTFTQFHISNLGLPLSATVAPMASGASYATRRAPGGYTAELALPHLGRNRLRISLTVTTTAGRKRVASLSRRNYPANPTTFAEIVLQRQD